MPKRARRIKPEFAPEARNIGCNARRIANSVWNSA
jgi:hypothetical protein